MNNKTNTVLSKIRQTLETELHGANLVNAELTEAEQTFIGEALKLIDEAGYEVEGFDTSDPDAVEDALEAVAEEEGGEIAKVIKTMLAPPMVEAAGPVIATVPSSSNPSKNYEIRLGADGNVYCSCPAWKYQKKNPQERVCKHMKALAKQIGQVTSKMKASSEGVEPTIGQQIAEHFSNVADFIGEAKALLTKSGYEMEGYEGASIEEYIEALMAVADEEGEGSEVTESIGEMLRPYLDEAN